MAAMTVAELQEALRGKSLSAAEAMKDTLARIARHEPAVHAFVEVYEQEAVHAAEICDAARAAGGGLGPLAGIPIAIKDNLVDEGHAASAGSRMLATYRSAYTATAVERLRSAGAIIVGRTNMDEFAMGSSTENSAFGATRNPWDRERVPGGSSGGSAAAVAAGMVPAALGSDTGGSIRQPAALTGIVGLKPTYGRVSRHGLMAMASSLDQIGTLTRTPEDAAILFSIISGADPKDATTLAGEAFAWSSRASLEGLTVGVPQEFFAEGMDAEVEARVREAIKAFEGMGAKVREVSLPASSHALAAYYVIVPAEVSSNMARYDGIRYGERVRAADLHATYAATRGALFGPEVRRRILVGTYALSAGYYDAYYRRAQQVRTLVRTDFDSAFGQVDLLLTPTSPTVAWPLGEKFSDPLTMYLSDVYTVSVNIAGLPAVSVPCGLAHGLPVGLQLIGPALSEGTLLAAAGLYQDTHPMGTTEPRLFG